MKNSLYRYTVKSFVKIGLAIDFLCLYMSPLYLLSFLAEIKNDGSILVKRKK